MGNAVDRLRGDLLMDAGLKDERIVAMAIQTVLFLNKHRLHLLADSAACDSFLRELSRDVIRKARTFKRIADTAVAEDPLQSTAFQEESL